MSELSFPGDNAVFITPVEVVAQQFVQLRLVTGPAPGTVAAGGKVGARIKIVWREISMPLARATVSHAAMSEAVDFALKACGTSFTNCGATQRSVRRCVSSDACGH